jgi:hypothetical protein
MLYLKELVRITDAKASSCMEEAFPFDMAIGFICVAQIRRNIPEFYIFPVD